MALRDLNDDGCLDLVTANTGDGTASLLLNTGILTGTRPGLAAFTGSLYPNPAHEAFTVLVPVGTGAKGELVRVKLFNALGQVVRRQTAALPATEARLAVATADLAPGVYTLRLLVGATTQAQRVVLQ